MQKVDYVIQTLGFFSHTGHIIINFIPITAEGHKKWDNQVTIF